MALIAGHAFKTVDRGAFSVDNVGKRCRVYVRARLLGRKKELEQSPNKKGLSDGERVIGEQDAADLSVARAAISPLECTCVSSRKKTVPFDLSLNHRRYRINTSINRLCKVLFRAKSRLRPLEVTIHDTGRTS